jgi:hypothetical protein
MRRPVFVCSMSVAALVGVVSAVLADDPPTYERDIRSLLRTHCTLCHNTRKLTDLETSGGLALDSLEAIQRGSKGQPVVLAGKATESSLFLRLSDPDEERLMPKDGEPLPEADREVIRRWIDAGTPRGERSAITEAASSIRPPRIVRTLDVTIPLDIKLENKPVQAVLKVGPLPAITALAFRPDQNALAVGTFGHVMVWDLDQGVPKVVIGDLPGAVHALAYSADGRMLAVGGGLAARSGMVRLYNSEGSLLHDLTGHEDVVSSLAFRPDGGRLASASFDSTVRFWNTETGQSSGVSQGHSDFVYDVAYSPDGKTLLSASKDRSIKQVESATANGLRTYSDHNEDVLAVAIRPDGSQFVTAGNEPQLRWWGLDADKPSKRQSGHSGPVHQLAFSGDGARLISASGDGSVRVWDGKTGAMQKNLPGAANWQYAAALSRDGRLAAAGGWDGVARVWDVEAAQLRVVLLQPPAEPGAVAWLAIAPAGAARVSESLRPLLRWTVGGGERPSDGLVAALVDPDRLVKALRGEALTPLKASP